MIGSGSARPPFPVTLDNWQSEGQLNWTFQHMAEIFPTVPISRGTVTAAAVPARVGSRARPAPHVAGEAPAGGRAAPRRPSTAAGRGA